MADQLSLAGFDTPPRRTDRVFFAIFPDTNASERIAQCTRAVAGEHGLKGKPLSPDRLHITICHLGDYIGLPQGVVDSAIAAGDTINMPPFDVSFDRVMSFRGRPHNLPFVLRGGDGLAELMEFQRALGEAMTKMELGRWVDRRFVPHVTLLYDALGIDEQAVEPIRWPVREFVLIHSLLGETRYVPLARWALPAGRPVFVA